MSWRRAALAVSVALGACAPTQTPFSRASMLGSLDQGIGGPAASARVGDFLLENELIRAVIEQGEVSHLPLDLGGSLVDLDLQRPEEPFRSGRGLDALGQIAPTANLEIARALGPKSVRITATEGAAEVTVAADAAPIQKVLSALGLLLKQEFIARTGYDHTKFRLYTEYSVRPGERLVRARTTVGFDVPFCRPTPADGCNAACDDIFYDADCQCPRVPEHCEMPSPVTTVAARSLPDRPEPMGISDLLLGDLPRPIGSRTCTVTADCNTAAGEECADLTAALGGQSRVCRPAAGYAGGVFIGDMLLFGGQLSLFIPGAGFDTDSDIRSLFDSGQDTLSQPLKLDAVIALGDRVSYGYAAPEGKVLVPVFGGPFSMGATAAFACRQDQPGCLAKTLMRSERWVSVGEGDPSSASEPLARARGSALSEVKGGVRWATSGNPVSGASVYSLADPRTLRCEGECLSRCPDLSGLSDEALSGWTAAGVIEANRCRSHGPASLDGVAGVESMALTDVGTDPVRDGRFRLALAPGPHVLVALFGDQALSAPVPISSVEGSTTFVSFTLIEPGRVQYSIVDERGDLTPGRLLLGRCLPGAPCGGDADCADGELCQAGACACPHERLRPLELGGHRYADGSIGFSQTGSGQGELSLPPGEYDLVFSHGPHSSVDRQHVTLKAGLSAQVRGQVVRTVDRTGWSSADFHVHAEPSIDCGTPKTDRVVSFLAEDMDFLSSSDHDVLTPYETEIAELGARTRLGSHVGVETTTQEIGHFVGYPLRYQQWSEGTRLQGNGAPEWRNLTPPNILQAIRAAGLPGREMVVEIPHPYSYFDFYGIDPKTLEPVPSAVTLFNPLLDPRNFSGDFDAMELMNGKGLDLIRRPTLGEVRFYSQGLDALLARRTSGELDRATYERKTYQLSTEVTRRILHRTRAEQEAARLGEGAELDCRCGSNGDCSSGRVCDPVKLACVTPDKVSSGPPPPDHLLCRSLRGVVDDWFSMLNRGIRRSGVSGADVHGIYEDQAGIPRTLFPTGGTKPVALTSEEITHQVLSATGVVTNGPMVHLTVNGQGPGATVTPAVGASVQLGVRVETAGWYDVDRVEIYRNGHLAHWMVGCHSSRAGDPVEGHEHPCVASGEGVVVAFEQTFDDAPGEDSWYVAIVTGLDGRSLAPVYSSALLARLGTFEITQRIYDIIPALTGLRIPRFPSLYPTFPTAVTNPVYVDLGGDGWTPPMSSPCWCSYPRDAGCPKVKPPHCPTQPTGAP